MLDPVPMTSTPTLHPNNEQNNVIVPEIQYSEEAKKFILFRRQRLIAARDNRDAVRDEWDGMGFLKYMDLLKKSDDQYIMPRKNKQDTAINLGTVRDKDTSLLEYAMKYDWVPVAQCFDEDDEMIAELAETAEDMVTKSKKLEDYRQKMKLTVRSMITFGTAMVEDAWVERWTIEKELGKDMKVGSASATWTEKKVKTYDGCQAKLWDLRKCYFGDLRKFFLNGPQGQPYFFTVEYISYDIAKQIFGDWERFKYVPTKLVLTPEATAATTYTSTWTLRPVTDNYCEIVRYYDPVANEYAITINGIDMLPIMEKKVTENGMEKTLISGFPLTAISPSGAIPFAKYDNEPMHDFVYSKATPAKMRVLADIENMVAKLLLRMMKQKSDPTMGNKSGRNFGPEVSDPATVINDIRDGDLFPILPNFTGPGAADFSMFTMVKKELAKNSVEDSWQGIDGSDQDPKKKTATQDMNEMKTSSLKVASLFDGIIWGEAQLNWLRTYNILANWTKPIDVQIDVVKKQIQNKYRTISMDTEVDGGKKATKKVVFTKDTTMSSDDVHQQEVDAYKAGKGETRLVYLHPEEAASIKLMWYYNVIPVPNDSDPLSYMMFSKQIQDALAIFGPDSMNVKKLKYRFASITGNDYDTWFVSQQELDQKQQAAAQMAGQQGGAPGAGVPGKAVAGQPTIAGAASGAVPGAGMAAMMK